MVVDWKNAIDSYLNASRKPGKILEDCVFSPSMIGTCLRQATVHKLGLKTFDVDSLANFEAGTMLHEWISNVGAHSENKLEFEKEITLNTSELTFHGFVDCFDGEVVYEFKTTGDVEKAIAWWPNETYIRQVTVYLKALNVHKAKVVFISKTRINDVREVDVFFNEDKFSEVVTFCKQVVNAVNNYRESKVLPALCGKCFDCRKEQLVQNTESISIKGAKSTQATL